MRILLVHNFYRSAIPSGENVVYQRERDALLNRGHEVAEYNRFNDEAIRPPYLAGLEGLLFMPWNPRSLRGLRAAIKRFAPELVHVHNTFPLISPAALQLVSDAGLPLVWTAHNFRFWCASAGFVRAGRSCTLCLDQQSVLPALRHRCNRGSLITTLPLSLSIALHRQRNTWASAPDRILALTHYQRALMIRGGMPAEKIRVKPNFVQGGALVPWAEREHKIVFVGRLGREKGVDLLIEAMRDWPGTPPALELIGEGDERAALQAQARAAGIEARVRFLGTLSSEQTRQRIATAKLLVLPSRWLEAFGLTVIEAYAQAVPVVAARLAGLPELVSEGVTGALFTPADAEALRAALRRLFADPEALERMGQAALQRHNERYSEPSNMRQLEAVYEEAMVVRRKAI